MDTLVIFNSFIEEIQESNSRCWKEQILAKYKDNETIKYYLNFLYNPYITTGISSKAYQRFHNDSCIDSYPNNIFSSAKEALEYLKLHNTSDYNTRELMFSFYMSANVYSTKQLLTKGVHIDLAELFYKLITKDLQLGIDAKTINKVIPDLIPTFNVQLANKYFDNPAIVDGKEFVLTTKIDGGRIIAIKENGIVKFYTRAGQEYEGLVDLEQELVNIADDNFVLDGEITLLNPGKLTSKEQYKETMKITRKDGEKHGVKMLVFDMMPVVNFKMQKCPISYWSRRGDLTAFFDLNNFTYFKKLPVLYRGTDTTKILELLDQQIRNGEEGIMINIADAPYDFKRTNNLLKVKKMQDIDLPIIGFEEGTNRHQGRLGAFLVDYNGDIVKVGSGLSDELRDDIWQHQEDWLGRTISIQYFEETTNQNGGKSLRFPVYLDYRTDK